MLTFGVKSAPKKKKKTYDIAREAIIIPIVIIVVQETFEVLFLQRQLKDRKNVKVGYLYG